MINNVSNVSFQGRRIYDDIRILQEPIIENTTIDEDKKDFSEIMKKLKNTAKKNIKCDRYAGYFTPVIKTDEFAITTPQSRSLGYDLKEINITNLKEHITRAFSANSDSHEVRQLFKECVAFIRNSISNDMTAFKG